VLSSDIDFQIAELDQAAELVHRVIAPTAQYNWPKLERRAGCSVWVKHENHTPTGAFKVRGGLVYLDRLRQANPTIAGVISATRGNHGQSIAFAAARAGLHFVPSFHRDLVAGVASYALELLRAIGELDAVYVGVGMGSGITGLITVRDLLGLKTEIIGVGADLCGWSGDARTERAGDCRDLPGRGAHGRGR